MNLIDKGKYSFYKYNPQYPKLFAKENSELTKIFPNGAKIEHVGSTAVPELGGKGIIDIAILPPKKNVNSSLRELEKMGFKYAANHPKDRRRIFMQKIVKYKGKERRVHLHICLTKKFWDSFIIFRDSLRNNDKVRKEYAKIKKKTVKMAQGDKDKYRKYKDIFIERVMKKING